MSKRRKKTIPSQILYYTVFILLLGFAILSHYIGWTDAIGEIDGGKYLVAAIDTVLIFSGAVVLSKIISLILALFTRKNNRSRTIHTLLSSLIKYIIAIVAIVVILVVWFGAEYIAGILSGLGILALIIGLGLQSLISDIVAGMFMVFEDHINVGDTVSIGGWRGMVKEIGIRTTVLVDIAGNEKIINNSNISDLVNMTNELSVAVVDVCFDYSENIPKVEEIIKNALPGIAKEFPAIKEGPTYLGVSELSNNAIFVKVVCKCDEGDRFQLQRDLLRYFKLLFDENHIAIPFNQITVSQRDNIITKNGKK